MKNMIGVSKEMAECCEGFQDGCGYIDGQEAAQDVINAAWTKFDYDKPDDWPEEGRYLCVAEYDDGSRRIRPLQFKKFNGVMYWHGHMLSLCKQITHYAAPNNLLPEISQ